MRDPRHRSRSAVLGAGTATAGWIFADMLIVLMIVGLGSQVTKAGSPEPPEPTVQQKKSPPVMSKKAVTRTIYLDTDALVASSGAARKQQLKTVEAKVKRATKSLKGKRAAMVLVWGQAPEVGRGTKIAQIVGNRLPRANKPLFADVVPRPLWIGGREGSVKLEMYVFS